MNWSQTQAQVVNSRAFYELDFEVAEQLRERLIEAKSEHDLTPGMREIVDTCLASGPFTYDRTPEPDA